MAFCIMICDLFTETELEMILDVNEDFNDHNYSFH